MAKYYLHLYLSYFPYEICGYLITRHKQQWKSYSRHTETSFHQSAHSKPYETLFLTGLAVATECCCFCYGFMYKQNWEASLLPIATITCTFYNAQKESGNLICYYEQHAFVLYMRQRGLDLWKWKPRECMYRSLSSISVNQVPLWILKFTLWKWSLIGCNEQGPGLIKKACLCINQQACTLPHSCIFCLHLRATLS